MLDLRPAAEILLPKFLKWAEKEVNNGMDKVIETSRSGQYTLEQLKNGKYVIKVNGRVLERHGEYDRLEDARLRWGCYKYA